MEGLSKIQAGQAVRPVLVQTAPEPTPVSVSSAAAPIADSVR